MPAMFSWPTPERASAASCWFDVDRVPGDDATTSWKRLSRLRQACWREETGYQLGADPYRGGPLSVPVGSRVSLTEAKFFGASFLGGAVVDAVRHRFAAPERFEVLPKAPIWADLLSSTAVCFNLFGALHAASPDERAAAVRVLWPEAPRGTVGLCFAHSPGRLDGTFLGDQTAFDAAFVITSADGGEAIVGVEVAYHDHARRRARPAPVALARYLEVAARSGVFVEGFRDHVVGTDLQKIWVDHLLVLAMLQHPSQRWTSGLLMLVYPQENPSFARAAARYRALLVDGATFQVRTLEELLGTGQLLSPAATEELTHRYLGLNEWMIDDRWASARRLVESAHLGEATREYVWLWSHMLAWSPNMAGVRRSFFADEVARLVAASPEARDAFVAVRTRVVPGADGGADADLGALEDWLVLGRVLDDQESSLGWFDDRGAPLSAQAALLTEHAIGDDLVAADRWSDLADLYPDARDRFGKAVTMVEGLRQRTDWPDPLAAPGLVAIAASELQALAARMVRALLSAERHDDAQWVARAARAADPSPGMEAALRTVAAPVSAPEHGAPSP